MKIHERYVNNGMVSKDDADRYVKMIEMIIRNCPDLITTQRVRLFDFDDTVFVCRYNNTVLCYEEKRIRAENIEKIVYASKQCITLCDNFIFIHSRIS